MCCSLCELAVLHAFIGLCAFRVCVVRWDVSCVLCSWCCECLVCRVRGGSRDFVCCVCGVWCMMGGVLCVLRIVCLCALVGMCCVCCVLFVPCVSCDLRVARVVCGVCVVGVVCFVCLCFMYLLMRVLCLLSVVCCVLWVMYALCDS